MDHSTLSQIMRGRRTLTQKTIARLRGYLYWTTDMRAVLGFISLPGFSADLRVCAAKLGISTDAAAIALQRLIRGGHLTMEGNRWMAL